MALRKAAMAARAFSQANPPPLTVRHFIRHAFPRRQTAALSGGSKGFSYPRNKTPRNVLPHQPRTSIKPSPPNARLPIPSRQQIRPQSRPAKRAPGQLSTNFSCFDSALRSIHAGFRRSDDFLSDSSLHRCADCPGPQARLALHKAATAPQPIQPRHKTHGQFTRPFRTNKPADSSGDFSHPHEQMNSPPPNARRFMCPTFHTLAAHIHPNASLPVHHANQSAPKATQPSRRRAGYPQIFPDLIARYAASTRVSGGLMIF